MEHYRQFTQDELLDSLTQCYQRYRKMEQFGGNEREYASCRLMLMAILKELNYRNRVSPKNEPDGEPQEF